MVLFEIKMDDSVPHKYDDVQDQTSNSSFKCSECSEVYTRKSNLKSHMQKKHGIQLQDGTTLSKTPCMYPECDQDFFHKSKLFAHLENDHGAKLDCEEHNFSSMEEFFTWKEGVEGEQTVYFSKQYKSGKSSNAVTSHYICQRDGEFRAHRKSEEVNPKTTRRNKKGKVTLILL